MKNVKQSISAKLAVIVAIAVVGVAFGQAEAANKLIVKDSAGAADMFVVTDTGLVGVGHSAPGAALDVKGTGGNNTQFRTQYTGTSATSCPSFLLLRNNPNGTDDLPVANDRLGFIGFGAMSGTYVTTAGVLAYADGNWTSTSMPSYYTFETTPSGSKTRAERMRVTSSGNIGIGTKTPEQKLEVAGGVRLNTIVSKPTCDLNSRGTLWFTRGATGVADKLEVCAKQANENYVWKLLF